MASVQERKNKNGTISFQVKVFRGRDAVTGKQLKPYTTTFTPPENWSRRKIEQELKRFAGEFESRCRRGEVLTKEEQRQQELDRIEQEKREKAEQEQKPTFAAYVEKFLARVEIDHSPTTVQNYNYFLSRALKVFGEQKIEAVTTLAIREYITDLQREKLSHGTISGFYTVLHTLFESAVDDELIPANPMARIKKPKRAKNEPKKEQTSYSESEIAYIRQCLNNEPLMWKALVLLMADSACRRGEVAGLKWSEVDFKSGKICICRNLQYTPKTGIVVGTPKSNQSRTIIISRQTLQVLAEWRKQQAKLYLGQGIPLNGFCFIATNGAMLNPNTISAYFARFGKRHNLPGFHAHALRHTAASLAIANGSDIVSVSKRLGHSQVSTTANIYAHANEEAQKRTAETIAEALYKKQA